MERATVNHQAAGRGVLGRVLISLPGVRAGHDTDGNMINAVTWTATTNVTYDAMDRAVEFEVGSAYTQIVYGPGGGKFALMNGQTLIKAFVPLAAGAVAVYTPGGLAYYRHADWLGSSRLASTPSRGVYYDGAYAPYGENYAESGTTDRSFTGQDQDMVSSSSYPLYDFTMREYNATWGRWISPDPAGLAAVNPMNPQTWNRYAYVGGNPMSQTDPLGLLTSTPPPSPPPTPWPPTVPPPDPCAMAGGQGPACSQPISCQGSYTCGPATPPNMSGGSRTQPALPSKPGCTATEAEAAMWAKYADSLHSAARDIAIATGFATALAGAGEGLTFGGDTPVTMTYGFLTAYFGSVSTITGVVASSLNAFASGNVGALRGLAWSKMAEIAAEALSSSVPGVSAWAESIGRLAETGAELALAAKEACQ